MKRHLLTSIFTLILVTFICFGCSTKDKEVKEGEPQNDSKHIELHQITLNRDKKDFVDLTFQIISSESKGDIQNFIIKGKYKESTVGLKVSVNTTKEKGFIMDGVHVSSVGEESNNFIKALSELYDEDNINVQMKDEVIFTNYVLEKTRTSRKYKLFFDNGKENEYAEIYLNINLNDNLIEINEKDLEYRKPILKAFSKE